MPETAAFLSLLQLASPALPVGAYSYSEGIETLAARGVITTSDDLWHWLTQELTWGAIRLDTAVMGWGHIAAAQGDTTAISDWNQWLSAIRETEEQRSQSWQMGRSLLRLFADLEPVHAQHLPAAVWQDNWNYGIVYGLVSQAWNIPVETARLTYLHGWASNLISAAIRAIPLGQTDGQRLLRQLIEPLHQAHVAISQFTTTDLMACSWGVSLASMQHEDQYSRLFRS